MNFLIAPLAASRFATTFRREAASGNALDRSVASRHIPLAPAARRL
jgi:hypothetical protein